MRVAVCDDSPLDRGLITDLLRLYFAERSIRLDLVSYENGASLLDDVEDGKWYDVIFLDIYMNGPLGMEVARRLRALLYDGEIVFLTASADFAVDSYDVEAAGYLLKPHSYEKLCTVMDRIVQNFDISTYQIWRRSQSIRIPYSEILYVESCNSKCILHRKGHNTYVVYKRLSDIEEELDDCRFLRCHQSYLVNMDYIQQVDKQFQLTTGDLVHIRQRGLKAIRQIYLDYIAAKADSQLE
ncbi:MAG: LytR/AlgR family response regulator transcription factor [Candidatus Merdivicinus sp.]|jgi:two-component system response regulator LytT